VFFPPLLDEQRYRLNLKEVTAMLRSKHQDKFLVSTLYPAAVDMGWVQISTLLSYHSKLRIVLGMYYKW
jgi:hypothetical protein